MGFTRWTGVGLLLCGPLWLQAAQVCDGQSYPPSSPSARFEDLGDGTLMDRRSALMWLRCSVGQSWVTGACVGAPSRHDWSSAQQAAQTVNQRGDYFYKDWRMPTIQELASITERECRNPRINLALFPATPAAAYWTASSRRIAGSLPAAFVVSFGADGVNYQDKESLHHVRLVRSAQ